MAIVPFPLQMEPDEYLQDGSLRVPWSQHLRYLDENWEPGEHVSVIAPTGRGGKSYFITRGLLQLWRSYRVLYIDTKDYDPTLEKFGYRVERFPNRALKLWRRDRVQWYRLHVRSALGGGAADSIQAAIIKEGFARAYRERKWVIVGDELAFLFQDLRIQAELRDLWRRGRTHVTFIAATQEPKWVPSLMFSQPRYLYLGRGSPEVNKRLGEIGGEVDYKYVQAVLAEVGKHEFLFVDKAAEPVEYQIVKLPPTPVPRV